MYQSVASLTIPWQPLGICTFSLPRGQVLLNYLCPVGGGVESETFCTVLKENGGTSRFVSKKLKAACKAGVLLLFHMNCWKKQNFQVSQWSSWAIKCQIIIKVLCVLDRKDYCKHSIWSRLVFLVYSLFWKAIG